MTDDVAPRAVCRSRDLVDVRLAAAIELGGCAICARSAPDPSARRSTRSSRSASSTSASARASSATTAFCRRHSAELLDADRAGGGDPRVVDPVRADHRAARRPRLRDALGAAGRTPSAAARPSRDAGRRASACDQGASGGRDRARPAGRAQPDPAWAAVMLARSRSASTTSSRCWPRPATRRPVRADRPSVNSPGSTTCASRLDGYAHHSAQDRRHLLTDDGRAPPTSDA